VEESFCSASLPVHPGGNGSSQASLWAAQCHFSLMISSSSDELFIFYAITTLVKLELLSPLKFYGSAPALTLGIFIIGILLTYSYIVMDAWLPPANTTFLSEQTSNQPTILFSQNKSAPATSPADYMHCSEGNMCLT
jgi:hypothetical protein